MNAPAITTPIPNEGKLLSFADAIVCLQIQNVDEDRACYYASQANSLAACLVARALEDALKGRHAVLAAIDARRQEIEDRIIARANHAPEKMPPLVCSGIATAGGAE